MIRLSSRFVSVNHWFSLLFKLLPQGATMSALPDARCRRNREAAASRQFRPVPPQFLASTVRAARGLPTAWRPRRGRHAGSGIYVLLSPRRYPHFVDGLEGEVKVMSMDAQHQQYLRITRARERLMARAPAIPDSETPFRQVFWLRWRVRGPQGDAWLAGFRFLGHVPFELTMRSRFPSHGLPDLSGYDSQDSRFGGL